MEYVRLGGSGLKVSRIGLGMMSYGDPAAQSWALGEDQAEPIVRRAVETGVTFFDTASVPRLSIRPIAARADPDPPNKKPPR